MILDFLRRSRRGSRRGGPQKQEREMTVTPGRSSDAPHSGEWRTYRCPVCGHTDHVADSGMASFLIRCSHCDTPLEIVVRPEDTRKVNAKIAELEDDD